MRENEYTEIKRGLDKEEKPMRDTVFQQLIDEVTEEEKRFLKTLTNGIGNIRKFWYD